MPTLKGSVKRRMIKFRRFALKYETSALNAIKAYFIYYYTNILVDGVSSQPIQSRLHSVAVIRAYIASRRTVSIG